MELQGLFSKCILFVVIIFVRDIQAQNRIPNRFDYYFEPNGYMQIVETSARYGSKVYYNYDNNGCIASVIYRNKDGRVRASEEYESAVLSENAVRIKKKNDDQTIFVYHRAEKLDSVYVYDGQSGIEKYRASFSYNENGDLIVLEWTTLCDYYCCSYDYRCDTIVCREYKNDTLLETRSYIYTPRHELKQILIENADKEAIISDVAPWDYNHLYMYSLGYRSFDKHWNWTKSYFVTKKKKILRTKRVIKYL